MQSIRARLTYANVMSSLAVFLILGGGAAIAAKSKRIGTNQIKAGAITTGKLKNGAVIASKLAPGSVDASKLTPGSVDTSKISGQAIGNGQLQGDSVTGANVIESSLAEVPSAASANPAAFAKVASNGVVDASLSKGITSLNVTHPLTGVYCVTVPSFTPRGAQATTQFGGTGGTTAQVTVGGTPSCPFPAVQVLTWTAVPAAADVAFYVVVYR